MNQIQIQFQQLGPIKAPYVLLGVPPHHPQTREHIQIGSRKFEEGVHNVKMVPKGAKSPYWVPGQRLGIEKPSGPGTYKYSLFWFVMGAERAEFKIHVGASKGTISEIDGATTRKVTDPGSGRVTIVKTISAAIAIGEQFSAGHRYFFV